MKQYITIKGAREHNLKNIDIKIPREEMVVITGLSGSGKSSLAFDTIYAEGQRRYMESLSSYARQFLGGVSKPDVDVIEGLSPAIAIDQKSTNNNPRSTVGTVTEIYDYLRILFARIGVPYCPNHNIPILSQTVTEMLAEVMKLPEGSRLAIMAPVVHNKILCGAHGLDVHLNVEAKLLGIRRDKVGDFLRNIGVREVIHPQASVEVAVIDAVAPILDPRLVGHRLVEIVRAEGGRVLVVELIEVLIRPVLGDLGIRED